MAQNIYDNQQFFDGYAQLKRSLNGLDGAPEWGSIEKLLPNLKGLKVIDLGCGYGWFSRHAREHGASKITALDISEKMLNKAKEMTNDGSINYVQQNLETLNLPPLSYNFAYSSLTLHYIVDLQTLLANVYQTLMPGSQFIFTAEHPIYTAPISPGWLISSDGQKSWAINSYHQEGERKTNWLAKDVSVIKQHRTLGTYINLLFKAGFIIKYLEEWGPTIEQIANIPALSDEKERPMLFLMTVQKPLI